jgi:hypothetical protein
MGTKEEDYLGLKDPLPVAWLSGSWVGFPKQGR